MHLMPFTLSFAAYIFRAGKAIPQIFTENLGDPTKKQKAGRPGNPVSQEAFVKVAEYLKSSDEEQMLLISLTKWESSCKALDYSHIVYYI